MKTASIAGVILGLVIVAWTFFMGVTGWYKHPTLNYVFAFVALYQIIAIVLTLVRTRGERGYGGQVAVGVVLSAIAAMFAFAGSIVFTTIAFPDYFAELEEMARQQGASEAEIEAAAAMQTPIAQAVAGAIGTIVTGTIVSLIVAMFVRKRA